jgi:hypothetical protein
LGGELSNLSLNSYDTATKFSDRVEHGHFLLPANGRSDLPMDFVPKKWFDIIIE